MRVSDDAMMLTAAPAAGLVCGAELSIYQVAELKVRCLAALDAAQQELCLDLAAVQQIDLAGVQLLLWLQHEAVAQHKQLRLAPLSAAARALFALLRVFPEADSEAQP